MGSDRSVLAIAGAIGATVIAAVLIVVALGDRPAASFPSDSPEAAVQAYLAAWDAEDFDAAYAFFSAEVKRQVPLEEYRQVARDQAGYGYPPGERRRVTIDRVNVQGDRAEVHLSIEHFVGGGGPFGNGSYQSTSVVRLVREQGAWKFDQALIGVEPGPFFPPDFKS